MPTDIEIARSVTPLPITEVAKNAGVDVKHLIPYGFDKAKVDYSLLNEPTDHQAKLVLVTAINPTPAGEGKTTTTIGLADGLRRRGVKSAVALREPSLGPVFGVKGGAAGGGWAQVIPMEDINLHFTGDFHAIGAANNLLAAMLDNHIQQGNQLGIDVKRITWKRVVDMNDRQLRHVIDGIGGKAQGVPREDGFDITVASEVMAILCLSTSINDLKERLGEIVVGYSYAGEPVRARDLKAQGAMAALLKDALKPNLVQTLEGTPAFVHGGPFANIAHGCNSIMATRMAMRFGDVAITEAGFGADLGAEKFLDIKCRMGGIRPKLCVLVVTVRGLKLQGGMADDAAPAEQLEALRNGLANMERHIENLQNMGQTVVVTLNRYATDTDEELKIVADRCAEVKVGYAPNECFVRGGEGCEELARVCVKEIAECPSKEIQYPYELEDSITTKVEALAKKIYRAGRVEYTAAAKKALKRISEWNLEGLPVCVAKTQYSFSDDAKKLNVPEGYTFTVRDFVINTGSGMIVAIAGDIMRMPGLPKRPQSEVIDIVNGEIEGLA